MMTDCLGRTGKSFVSNQVSKSVLFIVPLYCRGETISCPNCENYIDMTDSNSIIAFVNRIEKYKANQYKIYELDGNTVKMFQDGFTRYIRIFSASAIGIMVSIGCAILLKNTVLFKILPFPLTLISLLFVISSMAIACQTLSVSVSLAKAGKIEEKGNILNKCR